MSVAAIRLALAVISFIAFGIGTAYADTLLAVPALTARVLDQTGTLKASQLQALDQQLAALEQSEGSQVVVLMVATTAPEDIASYANRVANAWKIGRREVGDGVLVLVAKDDRKMRVEVAKTLEGAIPDIAAARIIDTAMKPRFREGDFAGGLQAAVSQLSARIAGEALPEPQAPARASGASDSIDWAEWAIFLFLGVAMAGPLVRSLFGNALGTVLTGSIAAVLAYVATTSILLAALAGFAALVYTLLSASSRAMSSRGRGGGWGGGTGGGWSGGSHGGGGFSSGGGGDFGGGGASGDW
ncbi:MULTISPECIES: TPM domain-containing protein [unclassified Acidovorax]|uniref:TPM domain-containing protein n=1 Tax=unclassified Acidovorax TaxID=2684926 RepID=UPI000B4068E6|nr:MULTISPECIES: TPM domain-containing protein [unclassified Acidovorax]